MVTKKEMHERMYELLEQLAETAKEAFPDMTRASFYVSCDEYRAVEIIREEANEEIPRGLRKYKYLELCHRLKAGEKWRSTRKMQNDFLEECGKLLVED